MKYVLYALLAWFLYNLIFKLIVPVYRATRQMRKKIREMQEQHAGQESSFDKNHNNTFKPASRPASEDYIEFEEIK